MRLGIVSDLHLEFSALPVPCADIDVLVLAGDIHANTMRLGLWVEALLGAHPDLHVVLVPGNHEFYGKTVAETLDRMAALRGERCHVLLNDAAVIGGVTFVGGTLWARVPDAHKPQVKHAITDFARIRDLNFGVMERQFDECVAAVMDACDAGGPAGLDGPSGGPVVVVTHFGPTLGSVHPKYGPPTKPLNRYFSNDLESIVRTTQPALWIHGHTHVSLDYRVGATRVVCNPRGYSHTPGGHDENPDFQNPLVLELVV